MRTRDILNESTASNQVVAHVGKFRDEVWDPSVLRRTELCLLDSLACYSAGRSLEHYAPSAAVAGLLLGPNLRRAEGEPYISPLLTAYLHGQAANALD